MSESEDRQWQYELTAPLEAVTDRVSDYKTGDDLRDLLPEQLGVSGGENFSAEDHRGREILELLQNATDATGERVSSEHPRTIYLLVTEDGVVVANTGQNFDFKEGSVRNSLRILGHSNKDTETIGEFGVGLTSIRAAGEAYEVWTKANASRDTCHPKRESWRVRCGPENVLSAVAQYADAAADNTALKEMQCEVQGDEEILSRGDNDKSITFDLDLDEFPYFLYPLPLKNWKSYVKNSETVTTLRGRAYQLLSGETPTGCLLPELPAKIRERIPDSGAFTTAVFIDFENEALRSLFSSLSESDPDPPEDHAKRLRDQAWFDERNSSEITPELLLNLGGIDRLVVEDRVTTSTEESNFQVWEIDSGEDSKADSGEEGSHPAQIIKDGAGRTAVRGKLVTASLTEVTATSNITQESDNHEYPFWRFTYQDEWDCSDISWFDPPDRDSSEDGEGETPDRISVLVPTDTGKTRYRPHLYYPIGEADAAFPVCLHGDFTVQQNRQHLAADDIERNCAVAVGLARLVGRVAEVFVTSTAVSDGLSRSIPWALLPEATTGSGRPKEVAQRPGDISRNEPFDALRAEIYHELRESKCLPSLTDASPISLTGEPSVPVLHSDTDVFAGIAALYELDEEHGDRAGLKAVADGTDYSLLQPSCIRAACAWLTSCQCDKDCWAETIDDVPEANSTKIGQFEAFISGISDESARSLHVEMWAEILGAWNTRCCSQTGPALGKVDKRIAHRLLDGTMELIEAASDGDDGDDIDPKTLDLFLPSRYEGGPFLLPCRRAKSNDEDSKSVQASNSVSLVRIESHTGDANTRQVLRPEATEDEPEIPTKTQFNIYLLTTESFEAWGQPIRSANWGTSRFNGSTDFFRSLLKDAIRRDGEGPLPTKDIGYLATRYETVNQSEAKELGASEGSYHHRDFVDDLVDQMSGISKNRAIRLNTRRIALPPSILDSESAQPGHNVQFGTQVLNEWLDREDDDAVLPALPSGIGTATLDRSEATMTEFSLEDNPKSLIRTLGIFGVSIFPGIRVLTLYRDDASPSRDNNSWDPTSEDEWQTKSEANPRTRELRGVLRTSVGSQYRQAISGPGFDPVSSASHTNKCPIRSFPEGDERRSDLRKKDVMVASWVWVTREIKESLEASTVATLLRLGDGSLTETVFQTGWSCNHGGGSSDSIDVYIPTVLSWQLRSIAGWETVADVEFVPPEWERERKNGEWDTNESASGWEADTDGWTLKYAVLDSAADPNRQSGQKSTRFLPRVNPEESELSETALRRLGVKPVSELNATEASIRLNALLEAYRDPSDNGLLFDGDVPRGWRALYGRLLNPIVEAVHTSEGTLTLDHFEFLEWIPVRQRRDGRSAWVAIGVDQVGQNTVYYDTEERTWESRIPTDGTYLLERPDSEYATTEHFESLCELHHESPEPATYPEIDAGVSTQQVESDLITSLQEEQVKHGVLAAAPVQSKLEDASRTYDQIVDKLKLVDREEVRGVSGDRNWAVQPISDDDGLELKAESVSNSDTRFQPVVSRRMNSREIERADLAELFQALFRGGQIDSYRLALSGGRVEGTETVRRELVEESRRQLETDLQIAGKLLDTAPSTADFDLPADGGYRNIRQEIAEYLRGTSQSGTAIEFPDEWGRSLSEYVVQLDAMETAETREWVGNWLQREQSSKSNHELGRDLCPERFESTASVPEWKRRLLVRLTRYTNDRAFLPKESIGKVHRFSTVVAGLQQSETIDDVDLREVSGESDWSDAIELSLPTADGESRENVFADVVPSGATWFHLAWEQIDREIPLVESEEYAVLRDSLRNRIAEDVDGVAEEIAQTLERRITGNLREQDYDPSTADTELLDKVESDLSMGDISELGDITAPVDVHAAGRNSSGTYTGSSGVSPRIAELLVLKKAYRALVDSKISRSAAERDLEALKDGDNYWHTNPGWSELTATVDSEYPDVDELRSLAGSFPGEAFDTTDEPRVGYDILDPTGALLPDDESELSSDSTDTSHLNPVPVEVKLVSSLESPSFRFSVNQFRRALSFVSLDDGPHRPYVIALVELSESDGGYRCEGCRPIVLESAADLYDLLSVDPRDSDEDSAVHRVVQDLVRSGHFIISS